MLTLGTDRAQAAEALLHEISHEVLPRGTRHSPRFWWFLSAAAKEAWPGIDFGFHDAPARGWPLDAHIARKIREGRNP